jgi:Fur family peroxide stress response transcriptional regulator
MGAITDFLSTKGIRPSKQRMLIYEYLYKNRYHPTVDDIYKALSTLTPKLSRTTVYNTLKLFVEKGVAMVVNIDEHEARYDADTSAHGHFKCKACGGFFDVHIPMPDIESLKDFQIDSYQVHLTGYCKVCRN